MLKTIDVLIGAATVLLLFSMPVTVITQIFTGLLGRRGKHLKIGLADLLQQLGIEEKTVAEQIAERILLHPMIADGKGKMGSVIQRQELTRLLLDLASGNRSSLNTDIKAKLNAMLQSNGIADPAQSLKNINSLALQLEASNPELSQALRERIAIVQAASSAYVARLNSWFDQTIDRVSARFTHYTQGITVIVAVVLAGGLQLNIINVVNRLSVDDQFRQAAVAQASDVLKATKPATGTSSPTTQVFPATDYYRSLDNAGLISAPAWRLPVNWQAVPGVILTALLLSLGAPFWYNALKNVLQLKSALTQKDDAQRAQRQLSGNASETGGPDASAAIPSTMPPASLRGEQGDLTAVG
jgi:hypothetical protein